MVTKPKSGKDHYIMIDSSSLKIIKEYNVYGVKCYEIKYKKDTLIAVTKKLN